VKVENLISGSYFDFICIEATLCGKNIRLRVEDLMHPTLKQPQKITSLARLLFPEKYPDECQPFQVKNIGEFWKKASD
jgi:hypothetical protein